MTILVDMDDTIEQLLEAWVERCNILYGRHASVLDVTDWNVAAAFPGLTREQVYGVIEEPGFWKGVLPKPGAAEALRSLAEKGHEIYIVTATEYKHLAEKMDEVLFRYFPFLKWEQVIVTRRKQMIRGDILIDDGPHNLLGGAYRKILFDAPHNRFFDAEGNGMIRVRNWQEAEQAVERIAAEEKRCGEEPFLVK